MNSIGVKRLTCLFEDAHSLLNSQTQPAMVIAPTGELQLQPTPGFSEVDVAGMVSGMTTEAVPGMTTEVVSGMTIGITAEASNPPDAPMSLDEPQDRQSTRELSNQPASQHPNSAGPILVDLTNDVVDCDTNQIQSIPALDLSEAEMPPLVKSTTNASSLTMDINMLPTDIRDSQGGLPQAPVVISQQPSTSLVTPEIAGQQQVPKGINVLAQQKTSQTKEGRKRVTPVLLSSIQATSVESNLLVFFANDTFVIQGSTAALQDSYSEI